LAVELLARAIHKEHADRLPGTAPFERCPHRADELTAAREMATFEEPQLDLFGEPL
jgi:hypothetical protein